MKWDPLYDNVTTLIRGYGLTKEGRFFAYPPHVADRMIAAGLPIHETIVAALAKQAEAGDEFAARALAEALRRRMMK